MTIVERIEYMIKMEARRSEKDEAGVFVPGGMDAAIRRKAMEECLRVVKAKQ